MGSTHHIIGGTLAAPRTTAEPAAGTLVAEAPLARLAARLPSGWGSVLGPVFFLLFWPSQRGCFEDSLIARSLLAATGLNS